ncbi:hypothetical protein ABFY48_09595 [Lysinibacillus pakistanensis]|uniref:hypothetical protein n=1 Tax=Lysinibacillus pakistanensis TaxID=759811 RepID=UPI003D29BF0A
MLQAERFYFLPERLLLSSERYHFLPELFLLGIVIIIKVLNVAMFFDQTLGGSSEDVKKKENLINNFFTRNWYFFNH